jgi:ectoine hydroxylase-related dioxygenase (phytanoyl-CoA dioxygenase family)
MRETFMAQAKDGPVEGLSEQRFRDRDAYDATDPLSRWPRMMHPHQHADKPVGPLSMRLMLDQRLEPILRELFGGEAPLAVQSMFYFKPPGARGQDLHQDNFYLRVKPGTCIGMWLAVDDADRGNGGMVIVPGSGEMEIVCPEKADASKFFTTEHVPVPAGLHEEPVDLKAGDVLFFNGSVIHGSYPNTSRDRFRRAFICHYVPRSTAELSKWYRTPMSFDGAVHAIADATGGGPCGNVQPAGERAVH